MKPTTLPAAGLAVAILFGLCFASGAADEPKPAARVQWEYKVVPLWEMLPDQNLANTDILQKHLDQELGAKGWELCGIDSHTYFFRRPK